MATYTVGASGGDYTTLAAAIAASTTGDTISILANFSHDGTTVTANETDLIFKSATGLAADAVIASANQVTFSLSSDGVTFQNLTINNTYTSSGYCIYANYTVHVADCVLDINHATQGYVVYSPRNGSTFQRSKFSGGNRGIYHNTATSTWAVDSCLFTGHSYSGIYSTLGYATIRNCTVVVPDASSSGIYVGSNDPECTIYNCVVYVDGAQRGIWIDNDATNIIKNCIAFGTATIAIYFDIQSPLTFADLLDDGDVTDSGEDVFDDRAGGDYHPNTDGVAYQSGLAAGAPALDLDGLPFANPPSRGCLEVVVSNKTLATLSVSNVAGGTDMVQVDLHGIDYIKVEASEASDAAANTVIEFGLYSKD